MNSSNIPPHAPRNFTLFVCERGNVRSATFATVARDYFGYNNVIATGLSTTDPSTMGDLLSLSTHTYIVGDELLLYKFRQAYPEWKIGFISIGVDKWHIPMEPDLVEIAVTRLISMGWIPIGGLPNYASPETYVERHREVFYAQANKWSI